MDDSIIVVGPMDAPGGEVAGQMIYDAAVPNIGTYSYEDSRAAYSPYAIAYMTDSEEGDVLAAQKWICLLYTSSDSVRKRFRDSLFLYQEDVPEVRFYSSELGI